MDASAVADLCIKTLFNIYKKKEIPFVCYLIALNHLKHQLHVMCYALLI